METVPAEYSKRVYQGVRVKHTVKDLLAEKRLRQTTVSRFNGGTNTSQPSTFVQMSGSHMVSGYYGVRRSYLSDSDFHPGKQFTSDVYSTLGGKPIPCDPSPVPGFTPLLDPYFPDSFSDYRNAAFTPGTSSIFTPTTLPPLIPHFSTDSSHYLLRETWEQTLPENLNQTDGLCSDTFQLLSSSTSCLTAHDSGTSPQYRTSSRTSNLPGTQSYSLHALEDVHYPSGYSTTSSYSCAPYMSVPSDLTPKMVPLSSDESSETSATSLHDTSSWPKEDSGATWASYEVRRTY
ncbi:POU domain class 2-associating factor 2 [Latimeria chalumnae]|uniref:POU domain class 2-associating factor 2 n=1 Tax=Latimeria chalumnae TaxID=7897 RepID=UPI0003C12746|nr:PREDICTED: uncharacterized protein C11orf53 homolog [Latimeria chalumnae]|eukprot:XP_005986364.1 PREDICTED: uncharacterized protein C11orf53 homolog [Latimeria chalumnae]